MVRLFMIGKKVGTKIKFLEYFPMTKDVAERTLNSYRKSCPTVEFKVFELTPAAEMTEIIEVKIAKIA